MLLNIEYNDVDIDLDVSRNVGWLRCDWKCRLGTTTQQNDVDNRTRTEGGHPNVNKIILNPLL